MSIGGTSIEEMFIGVMGSKRMSMDLGENIRDKEVEKGAEIEGNLIEKRVLAGNRILKSGSVLLIVPMAIQQTHAAG